jgi:simple sugar transport system ATP-binding protein
VRITGGRLRVFGNTECFAGPANAVRAGLALCPEDRRAAGIFGQQSVQENIVIGLQARRGWWRRITADERQRLVSEAVASLRIVCPDFDLAAEALSGGNQQKVILARWLAVGPRVLILDEPTRGIDIGAHAEIIRLIRELKGRGMSVIVASSELDELVAFSDRIVVMREHTAVAELRGDDASEQAIVAAIAESA